MECTVHKLIADVAVFAERHVLLVRYRDTGRYEGQEGWFLPDDFLEHLEHPGDASRRILDEQVGASAAGPTLSHIESFGNGTWHITFHFRLDLSERPALRPSANVRDADWFALDALPDASDVAHQGWALETLAEMTG